MRARPAFGGASDRAAEAEDESGVLSLFGVTTLFGMPQGVTLEEFAVESFFESAGMLAWL